MKRLFTKLKEAKMLFFSCGIFIIVLFVSTMLTAKNNMYAAPDDHSHKVCNDAGCSDNHSDITWEEWTSDNSLPQTTGNFYLTKDIVLDDEWEPAEGDVKLCLNGKSIRVNGNGDSVIRILTDRNFTLCDCSDGNSGKIIGGVNRNGVSFAATIPPGSNAVFNMYGGTITGVSSDENAQYLSAGVYLTSNLAEFHMYGGCITDNDEIGVDCNSGKVYLSGTVDISGNGSLRISMLNMMKDFAASQGIDLESMWGTLEEFMDIAALSENSTVTIENTFNFKENKKAYIFINGGDMSSCGTFTSDWSKYMNGASPADYFISSADALEVALVDGEAVIRKVPHSHKICAGSNCTDASHIALEYKPLVFKDEKLYAESAEVALTDKGYALPEGNWYLKENLSLNYSININGAVNLCLNGKTLNKSILIDESGSLNLCDCEGNGKITTADTAAISVGTSDKASDAVFTIYSGSLTGSAKGLQVVNAKSANIAGGTISGNTTDIDVTLNKQTATLNTPVTMGQPVPDGTKISVNWSWSSGDGILPDIPVLKALGVYAFTESDLENVNITVTANGYAGKSFEKKLKDGQLMIHIHDFNNTPWSYDADNHYHKCQNCDAKADSAPHTWSSVRVTIEPTELLEGEELFSCTVCNNTKTEKIPALGHTHHIIYHKSLAPTCTASGNKEYYTCENCNKWFSDENATVEITDRNSVILRATGHSAGTEWNFDDAYHYHECTNNVCNEKLDKESHEFEWKIDKEATVTEKGSKHEECKICGLSKPPVDIPKKDKPSNPDDDNPAPPDSGMIKIDIQTGEAAPKTELSTPNEELIEAVLTDEEKKQTESGVHIQIILTVEDANASISPEDKSAVNEALSALPDYVLGQYLDVNLLKFIGELQEKITRTNSPVTIKFELPKALLGADRKYSVIRIHDGVSDVLEDLDDDINTVTIKSDKFSTYALAYSEKSGSSQPPQTDDNNNDNNGGGNGGNDNNGSHNNGDSSNPAAGDKDSDKPGAATPPQTSDTVNNQYAVLIFLLLTGGFGIIMTALYKKRKEHTTT